MGKHRRIQRIQQKKKISTGTKQNWKGKRQEKKIIMEGGNETNRNKNTQELTFKVKLRVTERAAQTRICRKQ